MLQYVFGQQKLSLRQGVVYGVHFNKGNSRFGECLGLRHHHGRNVDPCVDHAGPIELVKDLPIAATDIQDAPDLGESELVPDFQDDNLALFVRQTLHRGRKHLLALVHGRELRLQMLRAIESDRGFAPGAALVTAQAIEGSRADRGIEQRAV
jgi:hypothetical protein